MRDSKLLVNINCIVCLPLQYLYAFSMSPMATMDPKELTQQPPAVTNCPFAGVAAEKVHTIVLSACSLR